MIKRLLARVVLALIVVIAVLLCSNYWLINRSDTNPQSSSSTDTVFYFGYGSNMPSRYLSNIRHVAILDSHAGLAENFEIQFPSSGIWFEPAFANLYLSEGANAYGVLHHISRSDLDRIIQSEGSSYSMQLIDVTNLSTGSKTEAWTLVGSRALTESVPSRRYLRWLIEGAREHKLPQHYTNHLAEMEGFYIPLFSECAGAAMHIMVALFAA